MSKYGIKLLAGALLSVFALGCPGGNNLTTTDEPAVELTTPLSGLIEIELPSQPMRPQEQSTKVLLKSSGKVDLKITDIRWIARPSRLHLETPMPGGASRQDVTSCAGDCANPICIQSSGGDVCVTTGPPSEPLVIPPAASEQLTFFLADGTEGLNCPTPPEGTPEAFAGEDYCGALEIKTNARTSNNLIKDGVVTIYFKRGNKSGTIEMTETFMEFSGVAPNFSERRSFGVQNRSTTENLQITSIIPSLNPQFFDIQSEGGLTGELKPGELKQYTMQLTIPPGTNPDLLKFTSTINVGSNASRIISDSLLVSVTTDGGAFPRIETDKTTLKFDAMAEQELTIENVGQATLLVTGTRFKPSKNEDFYTITHDGMPLTGQLTIPKGESKTIKIAFARPAGMPDASSIATLVLQHNDASVGQRTSIVLLGDQGDVPLGELVPNNFSMSSQAGDQSRSFAVINRGTAPLNIEQVMLTATQGSSDEFVFNTSNLMVAPGDVEEVSFEFKPLNNTNDNVAVRFMTNYVDPADEFFVNLTALDVADTPPSPVITPSFATNAKVGERTTFSAKDSTPESTHSSAQWVLTAKPAGSKAYVNYVGKDVSFTPDVAGAYKMILTLSTGAIDNQATLEFNAE